MARMTGHAKHGPADVTWLAYPPGEFPGFPTYWVLQARAVCGAADLVGATWTAFLEVEPPYSDIGFLCRRVAEAAIDKENQRKKEQEENNSG